MTNEEYKKELTRYWDSIRDKGSSMKEKPILFNTQMVRAILEGRKTVTRRVIKPQPKSRICYSFAGSRGMAGTWGYPGSDAWKSWGEEYKLPKDLSEADKNQRFTPPCHTDDILYVRETWYKTDCLGVCNGYIYKASFTDKQRKILEETTGIIPKWRPSIHMPKEAARIWLKVTDVRVERLQDMSVDDAAREGSVPLYVFEDDTKPTLGALDVFRRIWNSAISDADIDRYGWDANPWVWVIKFERIENRRRGDD